VSFEKDSAAFNTIVLKARSIKVKDTHTILAYYYNKCDVIKREDEELRHEDSLRLPFYSQ